jgi:hypothetical protein
MLKKEHDKRVFPSASSEALAVLKETLKHIKNQNDLLKNFDQKMLMMDSKEIAKALVSRINSKSSLATKQDSEKTD